MIKGTKFPILIEQDIRLIQNVLEKNGLSQIVDSIFINDFNLTLQSFVPSGIFARKRLADVFIVADTVQLLQSEDFFRKYINMLLYEENTPIKFIHSSNFGFSESKHKLATKNLRILVDDNSGSVPEEVLLHIASVATLMLSKKLNYATGYDYIKKFMLKYGYTEFIYQQNGYLHIKISENMIESVKVAKLDTKPKK